MGLELSQGTKGRHCQKGICVMFLCSVATEIRRDLGSECFHLEQRRYRMFMLTYHLGPIIILKVIQIFLGT